MSEANKTTLEDRIANFNPDDPEALAALEKDLMGEGVPAEEKPEGEDEKESKEDGKKNEKPDDKQPPEKPEEQGETSDAQVTKVVKTRDGKHEIPYKVLEDERTRANRAEATVKALGEQIKQLKDGKTVDTNAEGVQITDEDLADLEDLSPEVAKFIKAQRAEVQKLSSELATLQQEREIAQRTKEQEAQDAVSAAINANADLVAWREAAGRKENPDTSRWEKAGAIDDMLMNDPEWKDRPYPERFAKVVEIVKTMHGDKPEPTKETTEKETTATDLKKAADAKLKDKGAHVPTSLSEIPGGAAPAQSDLENLENISAVALGNKFANMSPEQMEAYLARFGT